MDFLRAVSILLVVMHVYWCCYEAILAWGVNIGVADRILMNFDRTAGLFRSMLYTKLFAVVLLGLSCLGTTGVKDEKITWPRIGTALVAGFVLFFLNWWLLALPLPLMATTLLYVVTIAAGYTPGNRGISLATDAPAAGALPAVPVSVCPPGVPGSPGRLRSKFRYSPH